MNLDFPKFCTKMANIFFFFLLFSSFVEFFRFFLIFLFFILGFLQYLSKDWLFLSILLVSFSFFFHLFHSPIQCRKFLTMTRIFFFWVQNPIEYIQIRVCTIQNFFEKFEKNRKKNLVKSKKNELELTKRKERRFHKKTSIC